MKKALLSAFLFLLALILASNVALAQPKAPPLLDHPAPVHQSVSTAQTKSAPKVQVTHAGGGHQAASIGGRPAPRIMSDTSGGWDCNWWGGTEYVSGTTVYTNANGNCTGVSPTWQSTLMLTDWSTNTGSSWVAACADCANFMQNAPGIVVNPGDTVAWSFQMQVTVPDGYWWGYTGDPTACQIVSPVVVTCTYGGYTVPIPPLPAPAPTPVPPTPTPIPTPITQDLYPPCPGVAVLAMIIPILPSRTIRTDESYLLDTQYGHYMVRLERDMWLQNLVTGFANRDSREIPIYPDGNLVLYTQSNVVGNGFVVGSLEAVALLENGAKCVFTASNSITN